MTSRIFGEEKLPYRVVTAVTLAVMLLFICRILYAGLVAMPYPKNMDDPANIALTDAFLNEKNPYLTDSLKESVPAINYSHPFLNSLLAVWIVNVFVYP